MINRLVSVVIVTRNRKKDLLECVDSYRKSTYPKIEIIVVDNASNPAVAGWLSQKYKDVKLITSDKNIGAAGGRNLGIAHSRGEFILFSDDDAFADKEMVDNLVRAFEENKKAGIIQPLVYDKQKPNMLQGAGHDINLTTGRIKAWGVREIDGGQYEGLRKVPMAGCVWMVRRAVIQKIGLFDEEYFIPYEDCDFCSRAKRAGFEIYCYSPAKTWHLGLKSTYVHPWIEWLGITSGERSFRVARNKIIFMSKHSPFFSKAAFFVLFLPLYTLAHSIIILATGKLTLFKSYWRGLLSGLAYFLKKTFNDLTIFILSWTDPVPWLLDRSAKTLLDIGCGEGLPMRLVNLRHKLTKSVGIDLFEPYLNKARQIGTHDQYFIKDITKLKFGNKSFDAVLASHVLEHLPKKKALMVLKKLEKIAKKQVLVAAPIGHMFHPETDGNKLQLHLSAFEPEELEKRGYKVFRYGWKWLLGEGSLMERFPNIFARELFFIIHLIFTPIFYIFPDIGTYTFVASKKIR